ncbi:WhiB family transcriptional regulator [Rhodococcus sp. ACPA1]|uniref:WhiB family transcriptional regulator n=1 Tax=Rhodococcus sp. ACPA1 TaxID=2028572 RepID=UPI000BB164CA|nr:WhiB family transcriptional regulator [Rhodococcus sp. ACPA1]PBC57969.1 WhiB family transcriptional regulator [Rhodococcus sp. ACPA1]
MLSEQILSAPARSLDEWEWRQHARCRYFDANLFFDTPENSSDEQAAKAICHDCPVLSQCRDYAVGTEEPHGIWGGLSPTERKRQKWLNRFKIASPEAVRVQRCS